MSEEAVAEPLVEGERTHISGLFVSFITGLPQLFFPIIAAIFGTGTRDNPKFIPFVIFGVMLISLAYRWIAWARFRFHLDEDDIRIESGLLNRTVRSIPYDRIQDVSIEEKPLARLMGLGEVKFETGGGGGEGEEAKLSFVKMDRAEALRETVRARKAEGGGVAISEVSETERPPIFAMGSKRLITLGLYSFSLVIFAVLGGVAQQFDFLLPFDWWDFKHWIGMAEERGVNVNGISLTAQLIGAASALLGLIAIGFATGIIRTFLKEYGFRLDRTERGFRRRRGFLTKTDVVMPVNRVQGASIVTGPVRKRRGWHALKFISLAQDSKEEADFMAAPLAQLDEIWPIARITGLEPADPEWGAAVFRKGRFAWWALGAIIVLPVVLVAMAIIVSFAEASFAKSLLLLLIPAAFLFTSWLEWRHYGDLVDERQIYVREGWWRQKLTLARQLNVQSVEIHQGPFARMLGLCNLNFGIAGGSLAFSALPLEQARIIRDQVLGVAAPVDFSELNRRD
jgi:putative membrane protein